MLALSGSSSIFSKTSRVVLSSLNELGQQKMQGYFLVSKPSLCKHLFSHQSFNCRFGNRTLTLSISWFYYSNFQTINFNFTFCVKKKTRKRKLWCVGVNTADWSECLEVESGQLYSLSNPNSWFRLISISSRNVLFKWNICAKHEVEMLCRDTSLKELLDHCLLCSKPQYVIPTVCWWSDAGVTRVSLT